MKRSYGIADGAFKIKVDGKEITDTSFTSSHSSGADSSQIENTYIWASARAFYNATPKKIKLEIIPTNKKADEYVGLYGLFLTGEFDGKLLPKAPAIIEGDGGVYKKGSGKALTFRSDAEFESFKSVLVDGKTIAAKNYTVKEGSTIVTLKADYLETLSNGKHTIGIKSANGTANASFKVETKKGLIGGLSPLTGQNAFIAIVGVIFAVISLVPGFVLIKRKKHNAI